MFARIDKKQGPFFCPKLRVADAIRPARDKQGRKQKVEQ
jgi:hypothetical protein